MRFLERKNRKPIFRCAKKAYQKSRGVYQGTLLENTIVESQKWVLIAYLWLLKVKIIQILTISVCYYDAASHWIQKCQEPHPSKVPISFSAIFDRAQHGNRGSFA